MQKMQLLPQNRGGCAIVSNHGGRQLDGAESSIAMLPEIASAVGKDIEVWMDGGIRSGQDILKAVALGARSTLTGRAFYMVWGQPARKALPKRWRLCIRNWI